MAIPQKIRSASLIVIGALAMVMIVFVHQASAATLSLSSGQGYAIGQNFPVTLVVSTVAGESINAVSATISYPTDKLSLVSISKANSIITIWASEPTFSNQTGTADVEGVLLNPGFTGAGGTVVTLNFKVKSGGSATLAFTQSAVLANDGKGTNVLTSSSGKTITLGTAAPANSTTNDLLPPGAPTAPVITSTTNPDPTKWYATSSPIFSWAVPPDVTAIRIQYDSSPIATPAVVYNPVIGNKLLSNIPDGTYYFHAQFKNANGWGAIANFQFNIDTVPPVQFKIVEPHPENSADPRPILLFNTTDALSGIDHYDVKVGDLAFQTIDATTVSSNPYTPPTQAPGEKTIVVNAYDKAGNETTETTQIDVQAIDPPVIDSYQDEITQGDLLRIQGHTYSNGVVKIVVKDANGTEDTDTSPANADGKFVMTWAHQLDPGTYTFTASVTNGNGATSPPSDSNTLVVAEKPVYVWGSLIINYFSIVLMAMAALAVLIGVGMYAYHRLMIMRRKIRRAVTDAEKSLHRRFEELEHDMTNHLSMLESAGNKRQLTKEEKVIIESFRKHLSATEKDIDAKLDQIRKEVK
jgi:hypothetical protein